MIRAPSGPEENARICDLTISPKGRSLTFHVAQELIVMALESRIRELSVRKQSLERAIEDEVSRPIADTARLTTLKRQKLRLKEELETLKTRLH
jgi:hypothetical protein